MKSPGRQNRILITNLVASTQAEIDLHALEWRLPDSVDAIDANNTPGRMLSTSLFEEASHELHELSEKLNVNGGREHCQGRSRLHFGTQLLTSSYRIATRLVPRHIIRLGTIPTQQQTLPRNGYYRSPHHQSCLVLPIQHLQSQLRLTRYVLLSTMSLAAFSTIAPMPHSGTRWLVQPPIRLEMLLYGFHPVLFHPCGTMVGCQKPILRAIRIYLSRFRQSTTSLPSTRSRKTTRRCSNPLTFPQRGNV
jgi:hypothetical protein